MIRRDPDEGPGDGEFYRLLWEGTIQQLRRRHDQGRAAARGPRPQPQLPVSSGRPRASSAGQARTRPRSPRSARWCRRSSTGRTSPATSPTTPSAASTCGRTRAMPTSTSRRNDLRAYKLLGEEATRAHRLSGRVGLPRLQVRAEAVDQGLGARLALRPRRRLLVDDRVLEPAAPGRNRGLPLHRVAPRPLPRGRPEAAAVGGPRGWASAGTSTGTRTSTRSSGRSSSAAGTSMACWAQRAASSSSRTRSRRTPTGRSGTCSSRRCSSSARSTSRRSAEGASWSGSCSRTPAGCRPTSRRRRSTGKVVRPLEVELTLPEGARVVAGEARTEAGQLEGRVHLRSALWWGTDQGTSDRRSSSGSWRRRPAGRSASRRAIRAPVSCGGRSS